MSGKTFFLLGIFLFHAFVSESREISRRSLPKDGNEELPLSLNPLEKDKKLGIGLGTWDQPTGDDTFDVYEYDSDVNNPGGVPSDYDYKKPAENDGKIVNKPGEKPEKFPSEVDHEGPEEVDEKHDTGKSGDKDYKPFDREDDSDKSVGHDNDEKFPFDEGKPEFHDDKESDEKDSEEDISDEKDHVPVDEVDEDKIDKEGEEDDDAVEKKEEDVPNDDDEGTEEMPKEDEGVEDVPKEDEDADEDDNDVDTDGGKEAGFFSGGSIFDTPFFNLEQVKKYFSQLDRALGHVFRQTVDEALLLNGTYANTTEEEIDIDGKKYIVQKSVIQGADNHSSIYVEALSSKPKMNDSEVNNMEVKNVTEA